MISQDLAKIRSIAEYQYGNNAGLHLFPDNVEIIYSRNTGRIRHIYLSNELQATFRPTDGLFTLTIAAGQRLIDAVPDLNYVVTITDEVKEFVAKGKNVFAKHVLEASEGIRPGDETIIIDEHKKVIAIGKALLTRDEMKAFKKGVAVKIRRGNED
jgi:uncharacterized protein with predicted RNA binding PUA domain